MVCVLERLVQMVMSTEILNEKHGGGEKMRQEIFDKCECVVAELR